MRTKLFVLLILASLLLGACGGQATEEPVVTQAPPAATEAPPA